MASESYASVNDGSGVFRQMSLPVAGLYLLSLPLVMAYRYPLAGSGATMPPAHCPERGYGEETALRRYLTLVTDEGVSSFSARLARLWAALAFVSYHPGGPALACPPARPGGIPVTAKDAASASTATVLPNMISP